MPSRKNSGRQQPTKSARVDKMARKRDERVARDAYRKQQQMQNYLADDENFSSFASQMSKMGLQLRDIPGDGNCLFRALGDQMQGHGRNHQKFRSEVTKYMLEHRADFEPFVEDDVPFERHVANLKKIGTYAGNDAIVAFARLHGVNVVIHQLNSPMWTIKGTEKPGGPELHISYHNGDHYSSVRRSTDNTETPACITIKKGSPSGSTSTMKTAPKPGNYGGATSYNDVSLSSSVSGLTSSLSYEEDSDYDNLGPEDYPQHKHNAHAAASGVARVYRDTNDVVEQVMEQSGCMDRMLVQQTLEKYNYDVDSSLLALHMLIQSNATATSDCSSVSSHYTPDSGVWSRATTPTRIFGGPDIGAAPMHSPASVHMPAGDSKSKISSREQKEQAKREKKLRAMERHRSRLSEDREEITSDDQTVEVTHGMGVLQI